MEFKNLTLKQLRNKIIKTGLKDFDLKVSVIIPNNDIYTLNESDPIIKQYRKAQSEPGKALWLLEKPIQYTSYRQGIEVDLNQE